MLPLEIFEAIIDQASDNSRSLRDLSLSCRAFLPRTRYHLFSTIVLQDLRRVESFNELLDAHPWAGPLVKKLIHSSSPGMAPISLDSDATVRILDVVPVHLLSKLPNLHTWKMGIPELDEGLRVTWFQSGNRSTSSSYSTRSYSSRVRNLELELVFFRNMSALVDLISAFPNIHTLTCSNQVFVKSSMGTGTQGRTSLPSSLRNLKSGTLIDLRVVEYLVGLSRTSLRHLAFTLEDVRGDRYFERLKTILESPTQLRTLVFTMPHIAPWEDGAFESLQSGNIRHIASLVGSIRSASVQEVRVEFKLRLIAHIGCCLAAGGARSIDAYKAFEDALLTFPRSTVQFYDEDTMRRAGRLEFWSATIRRVFPRLSERGLLIFPNSRSHTLDPVGHESSVQCLVTSVRGHSVVTASRDGTIIVWDWDANRCMVSQEWFAHLGGIHHLALSPDGQRLVSFARSELGGAPTVWDISNHDVHEVAQLQGHTHHVLDCAWSPDGTLVASTSIDGTVRVWDAQTFEHWRDVLEDPEHASVYLRILFSPNSRYLVAWTPHLPKQWIGLVISRPLTGEPPTRLPSMSSAVDSKDPINALSFDTESRRIVTSHGREGGESVIRVWDVATGAALTELVGHRGLPTDVSFSPDGRFILSTSCYGFAKIPASDGGDSRRQKSFVDEGRHTDMVTARISPDGKYVVTSTWGSEVQLWRIDDGSRAATFTEHKTRVLHTIGFSSDGEYLASGDLDGLVHIRRLSDFILEHN